jgi:hypothetical protein
MPSTEAQIDKYARTYERPTGAELDLILQTVEEYLQRFVSYPSEHSRVAHVLWVAHTHVMDAWESTPRLAFLSPEPGSGKTRALEVTAPLVPSAIHTMSATPAYILRRVAFGDELPTLLFDEIDTVFGPKAKGNEDLRAMLNAGHRRNAMAGRCIRRGNSIETVEFSSYCAVAMAGLGHLPDTIFTRSIVVRMRRRTHEERVEPFRTRDHEELGHALRDRLAAWGRTAERSLTGARPSLPLGIADRNADVWEPIIAVADSARGSWPRRARQAALAMVHEASERSPSLGISLLHDVRDAFGTDETMSSEELLARLLREPEAVWGDLRGRPLNARGLAKLLAPYGVQPKLRRFGEYTARGYALADFEDAWRRYLPARAASVTSVTNAMTRDGG